MTGAQNICVDDPHGIIHRDQHEFEESSMLISADDEEPQLAVVLLLTVSDGIIKCMQDLIVSNPVLSGTV